MTPGATPKHKAKNNQAFRDRLTRYAGETPKHCRCENACFERDEDGERRCIKCGKARR